MIDVTKMNGSKVTINSCLLYTSSNEEKEAVRKQVMRDNGSQIDFTA